MTFISFNFFNALNKQCLNYFLVLFGGLIYSFNKFSSSTELITFLVLITEEFPTLLSYCVGVFIDNIVLSSISVC
mgnify:CR=1 FL=1